MELLKKKRFPLSNLIGVSFGGLWGCLAGLALVGMLRTGMLVVAVVVSVALLVRILRDQNVSASQSNMFREIPYLIAFALEAIAIAAASIVLPRYGGDGYFFEVVGIIVGLHFLGLWKASGSRRMVHIAVGMCIVCSLGSLLPQHTISGLKPGDFLTGFGNALVLWVGASQSS